MSEPAGIYHYAAVLMGSPITLSLFIPDASLASRVFRLIKHYEDRFTVNRPVSEVMAINQAAGISPVSVSPALFSLIQCARRASLIPDSAFNLAIGPLVKRWRIGFAGNDVPPAADIARLLTLTRPDDVVLDESTRTVWLRKPGMEIDLGAIAKGYIADRVRDYLRGEGVEQALINLGGNVQTLGSPPGGWQVGLKRPFASAESLIGTLAVSDRSVVTSGIYERYFEHDGQRYHHILDPHTGYPLNNELQSVTVIAPQSLDCDIWTTLLFGLGVTRGLAALSERPDIEALFVTRHREVVFSSRRHFDFVMTDNHYQLRDGVTGNIV